MLFPDIDVSGLVLGFPFVDCDMESINLWLADQPTADVDYRFSVLVRPEMSVERLEEQIVQLKPAGLKPYPGFPI